MKKTFIWEPAARVDLRRLDRDTAMRILTSLTRYGETGEGDVKMILLIRGKWTTPELESVTGQGRGPAVLGNSNGVRHSRRDLELHAGRRRSIASVLDLERNSC